MNVDAEGEHQHGDQDHAAAEAGQRAEEAGQERLQPDQCRVGQFAHVATFY